MRNFLMLSVLFLASLLAVGSSSAQSFDQNTNYGLLTSSAWITDTVSSAVVKNTFGKGVHVVLDINDTAGTASVTLVLQGKDETSGEYYTLLAGAAKTAPGVTDMVIYPGCIAAANVVANLPLPKLWRATLNVPAGDSVKATVGASQIR